MNSYFRGFSAEKFEKYCSTRNTGLTKKETEESTLPNKTFSKENTFYRSIHMTFISYVSV